jgi:DNA-directed RNA polymerase specialized sigma subunit
MTSSNEPENSNLIYIRKKLDELESVINRYLHQLGLKNLYSCGDIKHDIFLRLDRLIKSQRLDYQVVENELVFFEINSEKEREVIRNFKAWLRTVIFNYLRELRRKENSRHLVRILGESHALATTPLDYTQNLELQEKLKNLRDEDRKILELFFFKGLTFQEIAVCLQAEGFPQYTEAALRQKKRRAIENLRRIYYI